MSPQHLRASHDGYIDANIQTGRDKIIGIGRELELERKDGKKVPILLTMSKVKYGEKTYYMALVKDISESKEANSNLLALKNTVDASFLRIEFDTKGNVLAVNQNFVNALGYNRPEDLIGLHHSTFIEHSYKNSRDYVDFWNNLADGIKQEGEFKRITRQGKEVWILAAYTPVKDEYGRTTRVVKIASDISNQKNIVAAVNKVVGQAGIEGKLSSRINLENATGDWKILVDSVNSLLESVAAPVMEIGNIINQMAQGDLTRRFTMDTQGDIKTLGDSLNTALQSLNNMLTNTAQIAELLAASSEEMLTKGEEMKSTTREVASATQQMAQGAQQQAQQTDEASKKMEELLRAANDMQAKAKFINQAAKDGQLSSVEGIKTLKLLIANMGEIQDSAKSTSQSVSVLAERSEEIASTLSVITDIAAQTNLLALNAAIEAARAGDAGRGFAVVAEEIRKLAEGSRKSAIGIEKIIREVQKDINAAARAIEMMEKSVKSGNNASKETEVVFQGIEKSSSETLTLSESIVLATSSQKDSIDATVKSIEKIVVVSEETASGTEQIATSSKVLSQGMNEVTATSSDLADVALQLQNNLSKFKLK